MTTIDPTEQDGPLVEHAKRELALIGEDDWVADGIVSVVRAFSTCGHSGGSAPFAIACLEKLLRFQPLTPLTNDPAEWIDRTEECGFPTWQSRRHAEAFSEDAGATYYLISECEAAGSLDMTPRHHTEPARTAP